MPELHIGTSAFTAAGWAVECQNQTVSPFKVGEKVLFAQRSFQKEKSSQLEGDDILLNGILHQFGVGF